MCNKKECKTRSTIMPKQIDPQVIISWINDRMERMPLLSRASFHKKMALTELRDWLKNGCCE